MRRFVCLGPLGDLPIQKCNLLVQPMKRVDQDLEDRSGDLRERLVWVLDSLHQLGDMSRSFGPHDAELEEMPAQGIDDLGPLPRAPGIRERRLGSARFWEPRSAWSGVGRP